MGFPPIPYRMDGWMDGWMDNSLSDKAAKSHISNNVALFFKELKKLILGMVVVQRWSARPICGGLNPHRSCYRFERRPADLCCMCISSLSTPFPVSPLSR
ncbi:hypothetical protein ILYODFUR_016325 [Ilyodon furcidens]|uniref:Uncharacterized protein n=1 Tax=Ilyodon furcidens TaxID=33524 RepID=A0ABV0TV53_9TELE